MAFSGEELLLCIKQEVHQLNEWTNSALWSVHVETKIISIYNNFQYVALYRLALFI